MWRDSEEEEESKGNDINRVVDRERSDSRNELANELVNEWIYI